MQPSPLIFALLLVAGEDGHAEATPRTARQSDPAGGLHFRPREDVIGDVHPFFENGECFLYHVKPVTYQSALLRSRDLVRWTEAPLTHAPAKTGDWMSSYYVLAVLRDPEAKVYRTFYGHSQGRMASSESADLLHWECAPKEYSIPPADYYVRRRDPYVFWNPGAREFGCVMTTQVKGKPRERAGAISYATSTDLKHWRDHGPVLYPGNIGEPECPQVFCLGGRWYLLASIHDGAVGRPTYWTSQAPSGPWTAAPAGVLDGKDFCAGQIGFDGEKPVLFGWIPFAASQSGQPSWGGHLALPREVYPLADGMLAVRLHPAVGQLIRGESLPTPQGRPILLDVDVCSVLAVPGDWCRADVTFMLEMSQGCPRTSVRFAKPEGDAVATIAIDRKRGVLQIEDSAGRILSDLPIAIAPGKELPVRIIVDGDIVEVFLCDRYSLAARLPMSVGDFSISAVATGGTARVQNLGVWKLRRFD